MDTEKRIADQEKVEALKTDVTTFFDTYRFRHGKNYFTNFALVFLGIVLSVSVSAAGFGGYGKLAGILGLFITLLIALQNAFYFGEKAEFQRLVATEAENLISMLKFKVKTESDFETVLEAFLTLKKHTAANLPRGKGMEVVRDMYAHFPNQTKKP